MPSSLMKTRFPQIFSHPPNPIKRPQLSQDASLKGWQAQRASPQRLQGVNATNRIFILRVGPHVAHVGRSTKRFLSVARYNNMERVNSGAGDINIFDEKFKASDGLGGSEEHNQGWCR